MRVHPRSSAAAVLLAASLAACCGAGCVQPGAPYWPTERYQVERQIPIEGAGPRIEEGRPIAWLDGLNHYVFSLPTKLVLWNWQALDHRLPEESSTLLSHYSDLNGLSTVKVRHNQYDPAGEWHRLRRNRNIGAGYRYTLGLLSWTLYTIFPGRLFAGLPFIGIGDHFNPFTNTIHVYSSDPAILLHEAGHAKDYLGHRYRGSGFALPRLLPGMDLIQEGTASSDAIHYLQCIEDHEREVDAYRSLYPAYATYVASYLPGGVLVAAPVVVTGHVTGRIKAGARRAEIEEEVDLVERTGVERARVDPRTPWCGPLYGASPDSP